MLDLCPICENMLVRAYISDEYAVVDPNSSSVEVKQDSYYACVNPNCTNYAGDKGQPWNSTKLIYDEDGKTIEKTSNRPNVNLNKLNTMAGTETHSRSIPIKANDICEECGSDLIVSSSTITNKKDWFPFIKTETYRNDSLICKNQSCKNYCGDNPNNLKIAKVKSTKIS